MYRHGIQNQAIFGMKTMSEIKFVVCIDNSDYPVSLEPRKIYESLADAQAEKLGQIRVVDESGEDYLYPSDRFVPIELSKVAADAVVKAA
jgi:hypothetical protein